MRINKIIAKNAPLFISILIHIVFLGFYQFNKNLTPIERAKSISKNLQHQIKFDLHSKFNSNSKIQNSKLEQIHQVPTLNKEAPKDAQISTTVASNSQNLDFTNSSQSNLSESIGPDLPSPKYPKLARIKNLEGTVIVRIEFDDLGNSTNVKILESSHHSILDEAAIKAAHEWKVPAHSIHELTKKIVFKLN